MDEFVVSYDHKVVVFRGGEEPFYEAGLSGRWAAGSRADILFNSNITNCYQISSFSALFQVFSTTIQYYST